MYNVCVCVCVCVQVWFKNRRAKWRKQKREDEAARRQEEKRTSAGDHTPPAGERPANGDQVLTDDEDDISVTDEHTGPLSPAAVDPPSSQRSPSMSSPELPSSVASTSLSGNNISVNVHRFSDSHAGQPLRSRDQASLPVVVTSSVLHKPL